MKKHIKQVFIILSSFIITTNAMASGVEKDTAIQTVVDAKLTKIDSPSHFEVYNSFLNKVSYIGRYYGTSGIGLYPTIAYKHKSGFETSLSNNVWTGFTPALNQSELNLGYNKSFGSWFGAGLGYARTFMYYGTDSDKLAMPNSLNLNLGFYLSWANISVDYSYMFGYDKGSALHVGISRDFSVYKLWGSDKVTISPGVGAYFAPQTVFYHFFSKKTVKTVNHGKSGSSGKGKSNSSSNEESSVMQALDYQFNLPVDYRIGHFVFELAFHLDIPVNLSTDYQYGTDPLGTFTGYIKYIF
jgi:hypothetical protein